MAWLMLVVYVPMVLLSSLHVHSLPDAAHMPDCDLCDASVHHSGHITATTVTHDECLSCRFLSTQLVAPDSNEQDVADCRVVELESALPVIAILRVPVSVMRRGPPAIL